MYILQRSEVHFGYILCYIGLYWFYLLYIGFILVLYWFRWFGLVYVGLYWLYLRFLSGFYISNTIYVADVRNDSSEADGSASSSSQKHLAQDN